jgi:hypothetical protein
VSGTVNGVPYEDTVEVTFTPNSYEVTVSDDILDKNVEESITFTLLKNGNPVSGSVTLSGASGEFDGLAGPFSADGSGKFTVTNLKALQNGELSLTATMADGFSASVDFKVRRLILSAAGENVDFTTASDPKSVITVTLTEQIGNDAATTVSENVTWSIESVTQSTADGWKHGSANLQNGLAWGEISHTSYTPGALYGSPGNGAEQKLMDIIGDRKVTLKAELASGLSETIEVEFGSGPLSVFSGTFSGGTVAWYSGGMSLPTSSFFQAAGTCGTVTTGIPNYYDAVGWSNSGTWSTSYYYTQDSKLPTAVQLLRVAAYSGNNSDYIRYGAAIAAGWPSSYNYFWAGEVIVNGNLALLVYLDDGLVGNVSVGNSLITVAVCLR